MLIINKFGNLIITLLIVLCFTGCRDDKFLAQVELPPNVDFTELDCWSYEIPFSILSDTEWEIAVEGGLCYVSPAKGNGNSVVKIYVVDNMSSERRNGIISIKFLQNSSKDYSIELSQKCKSDYGENSTEINKGNKIYAVGYGYNTFGEYASLNAVRSPIIRWNDAVADGIITLGNAYTDLKAKSYIGACVTDITNDLCADANLKGGYGEFRGEIAASFGGEDFSKNNLEYALAYVEVAKNEVYMEGDIENLRSNYMLPAAYEAINGFNEAGKSSDVYPSTNVGFKRLIEEYGTHFIMSSIIGGRLKYAMKVDLSKVNGLYSLDAFLNSSYNNSKVKASVNVSDAMKSSYKNNKSAIELHVSVLGGNQKAAANLCLNDNDGNLEAWMNTLNDIENTSLIGFNKNEDCLVPLYELVDINRVGGEKRYKALKAYLEGNDIQNDFKVGDLDYDAGYKVMFAPFSYVDDRNPHNSLIWDVKGLPYKEPVAKLCHEYIPVIDKEKRVFVLYPIIGGKTKFNMGVFMGNDTHRPAKVCWEGANVTILEDNSLPIRLNLLFIRGSEITGVKSDKYYGGRASEYRWTGPGYNSNHDYGLVKILDKIWLRENYRGNHDESGNLLKDMMYNDLPDWAEYNGYAQCFYSYGLCKRSSFTSSGWRVSTIEDYESIIQMIFDNQIRVSSAKAFFPDSKGGVLGFHHAYVGQVLAGGIHDTTSSSQNYGAISSNPLNINYVIAINEELETIAKKKVSSSIIYRYPIRLVLDLF